MKSKILKLNAYGKVIQGKYPDTLICIRNDRSDKSGHFILFKDLKIGKAVYLDWVKNYQDLKDYFDQYEWEIDWG